MTNTLSFFEVLMDVPRYVEVLIPVLKLLGIALVAVFALTACGGGGSGGGKSIADTNSGTQTHLGGKTMVSSWESTPSYQQLSSTPNLVSTGDPDLQVATGTPDSRGQIMASVLSAPQATFDNQALKAIETDHIQAYREGWTGKGTDILLLDTFQRQAGKSNSHGELVRGILATRASGARITSVDVIGENASTDFAVHETGRMGNNVGLIDQTQQLKGQSINYKAVNLSFGSGENQVVSASQAIKDNQDVLGVLNTTNHVMTVGHKQHTINVRDAVISKAAGNGSVTAQHDSLNVALMNDVNTKDRTILVGAKDGNQLASYSNTCGAYCDRFLLADGSSPYQNDNTVGTSYAAPRVTAIASIVRQKFSNINAERATEVLLKTARTDTINNYDKNIHGMGEASLSRALSPVGRMR